MKTTTAKTTRGKTKTPVVEVSVHEIEQLLKRAKEGPLTEKECALIRELTFSYLRVTDMVKQGQTSLKQLQKMLFGSSSEKTKDVLAQLRGADALPSEGAASSDAPAAAATPPRPPKKGHGRNGSRAYAGAEIVAVPHPSVQPGDCCPDCRKGKLRQQEPARLVRVTGQAPFAARVFEQERLRCMTCGTTFKAPAPAGIGNKTYDAKAASQIGLLRYGTGLPHNRTQRLQADFRMPLPASTQYEIVARAAKSMEPAHEELKRVAAHGELIHNDDTKAVILQVLRDRAAAKRLLDGANDSGGDGRTGIFTTGVVSLVGEHRIILFFTGCQHAGENLTDLLRQRPPDRGPPIQMCDGLDRNLPKGLATILANCLAHGRRQIVDVAGAFPSQCLHVLELLQQVYHNDHLAKQQRLSPAQRLHLHQERSQPVMDELKEWLQAELVERRVEPNSGLGKAINYLLKRWQPLTLFLRVAGAPLDNNICERGLKMAIMHRKNSLFYKTENGARVGDLYMSLINTARLCGANPFEYLTALQDNAAAVRRDPAAWLPWNYTASLPPSALAGP